MLFTLYVDTCTHAPMIVIRAYNANEVSGSHNQINVEVRQGGKVIFPRGTLYCGLTQNYSLDGVHAKELVMSLVAMKLGDTDSDYFASYTPEQLAWADTYGDLLTTTRESRYCDPETGAVRSGDRRTSTWSDS